MPNQRPVVKCERCGSGFQPSSAAPRKYCSKRCKGSAWAAAAYAPRCAVDFPRCRGCGERFTARQAGTQFCSDVCRYRKRSSEIVKACNECGCEFTPGTYQKSFCGDGCRQESIRRYKRAAKAKRKAIERKAQGAERFDPMAVFERDGWLCHLCGDRLKPQDRGKFIDKAPELDHVVPLSAGGAHTWANSKLACRKCNIDKGATPLGQPLLPGLTCQPVSLQH